MRMSGDRGTARYLPSVGQVGTLLAVIAIVYFLLWPLVMLAVGAVRSSPYGVAGEWTLAGFRTVLTDPWTLPTLASTVVYAAVSTAGCMVLGLYFATVVTRMDTPLRRIITPAMIVLVATPRLFYALSWGMLGNPNSGLFAKAFRALGGTQWPEWATVYSWQGLLLVTSLKLAGLAYILLYGPVSRVDRSIEDAAVMAGVPRRRAFFDVTLSSLMPALLAAGMLIFIEVLQVFDLPAVLGLPANIHTLPVRVNDYLLESGNPNWVAASALSFFIVAVIALLLLAQRSILKGKDYVTMSGKSSAGSQVSIGRWRLLVDLSIVLFILVAILLPILQVVIGSFQPFFGLYGNWTLNNFRQSIADPQVVNALRDTLLIAIVGGFIAISASFGMAHVMQRQPGTPLAILARIGSWVPATAPGIVLSLALLWSYLNTPGIKLLYGSSWLLAFALIVGTIPISVRAVEGIVAQVGPQVEEAARICGANHMASVAQITARLCTPSLLGAWFLAGLNISGTLDIPLLLQSANSQTVATLTFSRYTYGAVAQAAAIYVLYLATALVVVGTAVLIGLAVRAWLRRAPASRPSLIITRGELRAVR